MASKESVSITYYVGVINVILAVIWGVLYGFGILSKNTITSPTATPFYVGTLFAVGFGLVFPSFEKTMSGKLKINQGLIYSVIALVAYAGYVAIYFLRDTMVFYDVGFQLA
ncbi:MAG: hypothetical protein ICCCNLDF_02339 [Planctomycetes bacterium]|nr:hypothetical protein [Planctomycetota bacterium]